MFHKSQTQSVIYKPQTQSVFSESSHWQICVLEHVINVIKFDARIIGISIKR